MNILFLALDINIGDKTGDSIHMRELATSLARIGNEVFLIVAYIENIESNLDWAKKIPNLHLFFNKCGKRFKNLSTLAYSRKIAKKYRAQIIYERRFSPKIGVALSKLLRIPAIIELNGISDIEAEMLGRTQKRKGISRPIRKFISRYLFRNVDSVVAVTHGIKREVIVRYGVKSDKVFVIQNGANVNLFKSMGRTLCREKFGLNQSDKYVCFVGNLAPWQGVENLVKASPLIFEKEMKVRFLIVGDGILGETLRMMVKEINMDERFHFLGKIPYENVPFIINASDVCVAPFIRKRNEKIGLSPLKIYEYLACGIPVVASDIEGVGDFLLETGSGIAVEPENYEALAQGIIELLHKEEVRKVMGRNGRDAVVKEHSWDSVAEKVVEVCKPLI